MTLTFTHHRQPRMTRAPQVPIRKQRASASGRTGFLMPFLSVAALFVLPMFIRPIRPVTPLLAMGLHGRFLSQFNVLRQSSVCLALVGVLASLTLGLLLQMATSGVPDLMLAFRQIFYYLHAILGTVTCYVLLRHFQASLFSWSVVLAAAALYFALGLVMDARFAGGFDIRGNFEAGTVFFVAALVFRLSDKAFLFFAFLAAFCIFSVMTRSGQGVIFCAVAALLYVSPALVRVLLIVMLAAMPIAFPVLLPFVVDYISGVDGNVNIRSNMWEGMFTKLMVEGHGIGFGQPVYATAMQYVHYDYIEFEAINVVGMHNAPMQLVAFLGLYGVALSILLLGCLAWATIRSAHDYRVVACFAVLMISMTLNQAFTHIAVLSGTELLLAIIAWAEVERRRKLAVYIAHNRRGVAS
jgi:hypothetical protein